jgi:hypothetical protein
MDLNKLFGKRYVVTLDPSWDAETPENRAEFLAAGDLWWYYEIKGQCGMAYPYNRISIAVILPTRAARRLVKLMGSELTLLQHADDEMCYRADAKHAEALVRFIKPKSRCHLTPAHKAALAARLAAHRHKRHQKPLPNDITEASDSSGVGWQESEAPGALSHNAPILTTPPPHRNNTSHPTERTHL